MSSQTPARLQVNKRYNEWSLHKGISPKNIFITLIVFVLLAFSAKNTHLDEALYETGNALVAVTGATESSVLDGAQNFLVQAFPFEIEQATALNRLQGLDPHDLPLFTYIETRPIKTYSVMTDTYTTSEEQYLVHPFGYLIKVLAKMWESIEMGFWGTVLSIIIAIPLSILATQNYTPFRFAYVASRVILGFHRAMPELIVALFFVLMYGFGPIAGIFALAMHTSGVLGKFFADEIENAPQGPQIALKVAGVGSLKVLRFSVLPHVLPSFLAYIQYIFERNIRAATVLGIVGAGGIGMELKGRWDLFDYAHVTTILLVIFITVMLLEFVSQKLRKKSL